MTIYYKFKCNDELLKTLVQNCVRLDYVIKAYSTDEITCEFGKGLFSLENRIDFTNSALFTSWLCGLELSHPQIRERAYVSFVRNIDDGNMIGAIDSISGYTSKILLALSVKGFFLNDEVIIGDLDFVGLFESPSAILSSDLESIPATEFSCFDVEWLSPDHECWVSTLNYNNKAFRFMAGSIQAKPHMRITYWFSISLAPRIFRLRRSKEIFLGNRLAEYLLEKKK